MRTYNIMIKSLNCQKIFTYNIQRRSFCEAVVWANTIRIGHGYHETIIKSIREMEIL